MTTLKTTTDGMLTVAQVADYLQLNKLTVYKYIREGKIPALKIGRVIRVRSGDVSAFLAGQRVMPQQRPAIRRERSRAAATQRGRRRRPLPAEDVRIDPQATGRREPREAVITISPLDSVIRGVH